jgi:hypothetical protein
MAFLDKHGVEARVFYTNILYLTMTLLAALVCAALNAPFGADDKPRFEQCALGGADAQSTCANEGALTDAEANQNQQLFNISLATAIVNGLLAAFSVLNHFPKDCGKATSGWGMSLAFNLQPVFSLVNIGIFAGLVGWFNATEATDAEYEANLENNVFFSDYDSRAIAMVGLVAGVVDTVLFHGLNMFYFKDNCLPKAE